MDPGDATSNEDLNRAFNAFVVFNQQQVLACRDFAFLQLAPDDQCVSCACAFDKSDPRNYTTASVVDRAGGWKHLAVTWNANRNGLTSIYVDGLLIAAVEASERGHGVCRANCLESHVYLEPRRRDTPLPCLGPGTSAIRTCTPHGLGLERRPI